jgi:3-hydroxyisobutyrate dehydrogenase-like beta-hydroxyacid dehydrogenase
MTRIGFVGLGAMGSRMAGRFLASGHQVYGTNRTAGKAAPLIERGLAWCDTPREVARSAEVIFSMIQDDAALAAIASGPDGIIAGLAPGKVWVDMSTVSAGAARAVADSVGRVGAAMLSAPVLGSVPVAEQGKLEVMAGGDEAVFERVEPLLRELGRRVNRIGTNEQALLMKIAINISIAEQMLAFAEGVLLAERGGIDRKVAVELMAESAIGSPTLKARAPFVLELPQEAWFNLRLMQKDLRLALDAAASLDVPLRGAAVANEIITVGRKLGYGERDVAALFEVLSRIGGGTVSRAATSAASREK